MYVAVSRCIFPGSARTTTSLCGEYSSGLASTRCPEIKTKDRLENFSFEFRLSALFHTKFDKPILVGPVGNQFCDCIIRGVYSMCFLHTGFIRGVSCCCVHLQTSKPPSFSAVQRAACVESPVFSCMSRGHNRDSTSVWVRSDLMLWRSYQVHSLNLHFSTAVVAAAAACCAAEAPELGKSDRIPKFFHYLCSHRISQCPRTTGLQLKLVVFELLV